MSRNTGKSAQGIVLKMSDMAGTPVFRTIGNVAGLTTSGQTREIIDATHLDSTDGYREILTSFKSGGTVSFTAAWDPSNPTHAGTGGLKESFDDGTLVDYQIDCTGAGVDLIVEFAAYVTTLGLEANIGQLFGRPVTLTISGPVTEDGATP